MAELVPGVPYAEFVREASRYRKETAFRASPFFRQHGAAILRLLTTPRIIGVPACAPAGAARPGKAAPAGLRLVHWNIEKGKVLDGVTHHLLNHPDLKGAALVTLNEVDVGSARGGNCDQPARLAEALGCTAVYLPGFIDCTKGVGDDLLAPGENELGLHGLAVLSRLPVREARMKALPSCFDTFDFHEKRFGFRQGLYVKLEWRGRPLVLATTHLEVRRRPRCRALQFRAFLKGLEEARDLWGREAPVILAGDWNTNTFDRGGLLPSARGFLRILRTRPESLEEELVRPAAREPLFAELEAAGFAFEPFNDHAPTVRQDLGTVEDLALLPADLGNWLRRRFRLDERVLSFRLDWIAAIGLRAVEPPRTVGGLMHGGRPVSDHAAIMAGLG